MNTLKCFALVLVTGLAFGNEPPAAVPSPSPSSAPAAAAAAAPATKLISKTDASSLLREYLKAQKTEVKALEHRQKLELAELKASQRARQKEWQAKENEARRKYFEEHTKGPERREFVKEGRERYKALQAVFKDELGQRQREHEVRRKAVYEEQQGKLKEFQENLTRNEYPPARLWPASGQ